MLEPSLPFIRRRLLCNPLSWALRILDKAGLMKQPLETELLSSGLWYPSRRPSARGCRAEPSSIITPF